MKKILLKLSGLLILICIVYAIFVSKPMPATALDTTPTSVINNFGKDPETQRNFTWFTSESIKTSGIEYCPKNEFMGFDKKNIIKVIDHNYKTNTDTDTFMVHKVELDKLQPGTEYVYRVGSSISGYSEQGLFRTAEQNLNSFTFINITDTQGSNAKDYALWKNTLDKALAKFPSAKFLLHTGDMTDNGGKTYQWDLFTDAAKRELLSLPIEPVVGNHEVINTNNKNKNAKNFTDRFNLPKELNTGTRQGTVYSFDYGNVHIAIMNTQCGSSNFKKQSEWLKTDMKKSNKPWKIVALHRGPYGATYDTTDIRNAWAPVFDELKIDLVLSGHDHNYVRSYPMKNNSKVKAGQGTLYMISNTGGIKFYPKKSRSWQKVNFQPYTQMYLAITTDKQQMKIGAYDIKNVLRDAITLSK
jgi:hypothetical protein